MSDAQSEKPKVKKLEINDESVQELTDADADEVSGGVMRQRAVFADDDGDCGSTSTFLSTCTKVDTATNVPSTEGCAR